MVKEQDTEVVKETSSLKYPQERFRWAATIYCPCSAGLGGKFWARDVHGLIMNSLRLLMQA